MSEREAEKGYKVDCSSSCTVFDEEIVNERKRGEGGQDVDTLSEG